MSTTELACMSTGGPPRNTDVSGSGVRVSFYLQTLFHAYSSARSTSPDETTSSLYTLILTNVAMTVTVLTLGLKRDPEITFHDALVVFYLLYVSWICVYFSIPGNGLRVLKYCSVFQTYLFFAFALTLLIKAETFGSHPECNRNAVVVLFRPFPALKSGRILGWILIILTILAYTFIAIKDVTSRQIQRVKEKIKMFRRRDPQPEVDIEDLPTNVVPPTSIPDTKPVPSAKPRPHKEEIFEATYAIPVDWNMLVKMTLVTILWALAVMNTELLITWSHFEESENSRSVWQFGQLLPLFLIVIPLIGMANNFEKHGFRRVTD